MTSVANTYARADAVGAVNGIAGLDATGKVPSGQLPIKTYSGTITGNNSATTFTLTHGLGVVPKSITIREVSTGKCIEMATTTTSTQIILSVNTAIPTGVSYNIYAIG